MKKHSLATRLVSAKTAARDFSWLIALASAFGALLYCCLANDSPQLGLPSVDFWHIAYTTSETFSICLFIIFLCGLLDPLDLNE